MKPGYKQTEVGVIPQDWEVVRLKGRVSIGHGYAFGSQYFASHGLYRLTTPGHFYEAGGFRDIGEKQKYYVGPVPSDYILHPGDVIVAMTEQADGLLGSAAVIPHGHRYIHNQRLGRVKILASEIELGYLVNVFNSPAYRTKVRETAAGTKVKHTSPDKLLEISVRLPRPTEQRAIAEALSDVDALLGALDQLIAKKRDLKQAAMQQLLAGETRLPGFPGEREVVRMSDLLAGPIQNGVFTEPLRKGRGCKLINVGDLYSKTPIDEQSLEMFDADAAEIARFGAAYGDVFFTRSSLTPDGIAHCNIYAALEKEVTVFDCHIIRVRPNLNRVDPFFLFRYCTAYDARKYLIANAKTTTMTTIDQAVVANLPIKLPSLTEQTAIADALSDMDAELTVLRQRREKTRALKQGMMHELLTGKTRLIS